MHEEAKVIQETPEDSKQVKDIRAFLEPVKIDENKIGVFTRIRPLFEKEKLEKELAERSYIASDNVVQIEGKDTSLELFKCNKVFGEGSTQE